MKLAPLSLDHAEAMATWMADPRVAGGLGLRKEPSLESTRSWIERADAEPTTHPFAIVAGDVHVGNIVLDLLDTHLGTARLSIYVGEPEAQGAGIAQAAIALVVVHATDTLLLHKLWLTVHTANAPAIAAYARCGFVAEGVLRDEFLIDGVRTDVLRMGLIVSEARR